VTPLPELVTDPGAPAPESVTGSSTHLQLVTDPGARATENVTGSWLAGGR
jgi:hypothetical protein